MSNLGCEFGWSMFPSSLLISQIGLTVCSSVLKLRKFCQAPNGWVTWRRILWGCNYRSNRRHSWCIWGLGSLWNLGILLEGLVVKPANPYISHDWFCTSLNTFNMPEVLSNMWAGQTQKHQKTMSAGSKNRPWWKKMASSCLIHLWMSPQSAW